MKKTLLYLMTVCAVLALGAWLLLPKAPSSASDAQTTAVAMPWDITLHKDGSTEVFGVHLGSTTLADTIVAWGMPDSIALFAKDTVPISVEVWFSHPRVSPMRAGIVLTLAVETSTMQTMMDEAQGHKTAADGDKKYILSDSHQEQLLQYNVKTLSYIPAYKGLEPAYLEQHVGRPAASWQQSEHLQSWYYPDKGLTLIIDAEGKDVFQYQLPTTLQLPAAATALTAPDA